MILTNAFSANMLAEFPVSVTFTEVSAAEARVLLMSAAEAEGEADFIRSAVGHAATAEVFAEQLGIPVECRRETITLRPGDQAVIGQYNGPRLAEGATTLPAGASIRWLIAEVSEAAQGEMGGGSDRRGSVVVRRKDGAYWLGASGYYGLEEDRYIGREAAAAAAAVTDALTRALGNPDGVDLDAPGEVLELVPEGLREACVVRSLDRRKVLAALARADGE